MSAPVIGVIASHYAVSSRNRAFFGAFPSYLESVSAAGGLPVIIPLGLPEQDLYALLARIDGVLLTGGGDINPELYGEPATHESLRSIVPLRDENEALVTRWAVDNDVPLLGICRGHQMLNVALGGKLVIDIPTQLQTDIQHSYFSAGDPLDHIAHSVRIAPESRLGRLVGTTRLQVNSRHHQAIMQLGKDLIPTAWSEDNIIEASELPGARFIMSVQWHPENLLARQDGATLALFRGLVESAA